MAYPQQGYFVQAPMPQPQRFFNQAQVGVRGAQPRWPQQPRGAIPPGQMQMGMNAGFRTRGPSGPRMNQAQAAAAAAMAAPTKLYVYYEAPRQTKGDVISDDDSKRFPVPSEKQNCHD